MGFDARIFLLAIAPVATLLGCLQSGLRVCDSGTLCPPDTQCADSGGAPICVALSCGDGRIDPGESCDDGNLRSGDACPADCGFLPCGNGQLDPAEDCDDNNRLPGDGCSPSCQYEVCGNGTLDPPESCDDGNERNHDGCSSRCGSEGEGWFVTDTAPEPRTGHAIAYDASRGSAVVFGGSGPDGLLRDTWEWNGTLWRRRAVTVVPPARAGHAMAYDAARGRTVMFGGGGRSESGTWEWDGTQWTRSQSSNEPPAQLIGPAMAYDGVRRKVVLFGGRLGTAYQNATWEWDGDTWRELAFPPSSAVPAARADAALAFDPRRGTIVLFGGVGSSGSLRRLSDTWELGANGWTERTVVGPAPRSRAGMTFHADEGAILLFGGDGTEGVLGDTWTWDGASWQRLATTIAPSARAGAAMSYDIAHRHVVLFGGQGADELSDTWVHDGASWRERTPVRPGEPRTRSHFGLAYDPAREVVVLFGGLVGGSPPTMGALVHDTWTWEDAGWKQYETAERPPDRSDFTIGNDARHVVLFGGTQVQNGMIERLDDTWLLVDARWVLQATEIAPPARAAAAMAYDVGRGQLVMFGGESTALFGVRSDTWEWDGTRWTERPGGPPGRSHAAIAYDAGRGRVMMFGGLGDFEALRDTWEWDGTRWTQRFPAHRPAKDPSAMAYDEAHGALILYSGSDAWVWDGSDWQLLPTSQVAVPERQAIAYDAARRRLVLASATSATVQLSAWDGGRWRAVEPAGLPAARVGAAMTYDAARGTAVLFGGAESVPSTRARTAADDTWTWDGSEWREQHPAAAPHERRDAAMAFDSARKRVVLFGGSPPDSSVGFSDTWEWDGANWLAQAPSVMPPARSGHAMVYDAARRQILLLGGIVPDLFGEPGIAPREQWAWDGTRWSRAVPQVAPQPRRFLAATYDAARERIVLFGGSGDGGFYLDDTWEWDGTRWANVSPPFQMGRPAARIGHTLVYDPTRRRVALFGGQSTTAALNDVWEWDGVRWTEQPLSTRPPPRAFHTMIYDQARGMLVMFGGGSATRLRDTWLYQPFDAAVPNESCLLGFDGDRDRKIGCQDPDCSGLCVLCGDGVCDATESCRLCPGDCGECRSCGDLLCDPGESCVTCSGDCGACP